MIDGSTWSPVSSTPDLGIPRADVVDGVAGRVHREPLAAADAYARRRGARAAVGSGGVNSKRMARIISLRLSGGPWLRVPHGVIAPHGLDVASVSSVSSCTTSASSSIVGSSSGSTSSDCASAAASISARLASPSVSARCGLGPFTVHVEKAWCVISSAPVSRAMRPAPPKWSGCECVTTTVCTSFSW